MTREITLCDTSAIKEAEACIPLSSTSIKKMQQKKKNTDEDDLVSVLTAAGLGKYTAVLRAASREEFTLTTAAGLTNGDFLKELGIPMAPRKDLLQLFAARKESSVLTGSCSVCKTPILPKYQSVPR